MAEAADVERLFLQAFLSRGVTSGDVALLLWEKCAEAVQAAGANLYMAQYKGRDAWETFVPRINQSLDKLDLEFRQVHDQISGKEVYALVNRKGDEIAQMATDYSAAEINFFKAVVEQIMLAPKESFSVSSLAALREVTNLRPKTNMSKAQAEAVLGSFVAKGWLLKSKRGRYSLSSRSLLELLPYLKATYADELIECTICLEILTCGVACLTRNCKTRMHYHCFSTFRRNRSSCPACNADWPREPKDERLIPVGEDAVRDGEPERRRIRHKTGEQPADEEDEDEHENESNGSPAPEARSQARNRSRRQNGKQRARNGSMDLDTDHVDDGDNADDDGEADNRPALSKAKRRTRR